MDERKMQLLYQLYDERKHTVKEICHHILDISRSTLYTYLQRRVETKSMVLKKVENLNDVE